MSVALLLIDVPLRTALVDLVMFSMVGFQYTTAFCLGVEADPFRR